MLGARCSVADAGRLAGFLDPVVIVPGAFDRTRAGAFPAGGDEQQHRRAFRRTVKWRTGSEARISTLKRQYGWDRTRLDHLDGARIWTGHGVLAHNLVKIAALAA